MFREIKNQYEGSPREKQDKLDYFKNVHSCLMEITDINLLMKESNAERLVIERGGANVGWYSLNILKMYPLVRVFSIEPSLVTFGRLKNNFVLNHLSTENLVNLGFYKENGKLDFYYDDEWSGASSLVNLRERENAPKECVEMARPDDWAVENRVGRN